MPPLVRPKPLAALLAVALVAVTAAAEAAAVGTGTRGGFAPVEPQSVNVSRIEDIYWFIMAFAVFVFLLVTIPLLVFVVRFRSNGRPRHVEGPQIRGNTGFELAWTALPVVILVIVAGYVFYKVPGIVDPAGADGDAGFVRVEGRQFYWQYEYPNGVIAIDRLRAPLDRIVVLEITAPENDVNHSYWVPGLGGKFDSIPGRTTRTAFQARKPGIYEGQCGELCGIQHAAMLAEIEVIPADEFDAWLTEETQLQETGDSDLGEQIFTGACEKCHGEGGEGDIGPGHSASTVSNAASVAEIVRNGRGRMPPIGEEWDERQMKALTDYLRERFAGNQG
jgi:cytochrome c oxidase subunit II